MNPLPSLKLLLLATLLTGCAGRANRLDRPPPPPPSYPPAQNVPLDPALQGAAKQEIMVALDARDPLIRAHAIEAVKDGIGASGADAIIRHLSDDSAVVRFAAALAAGELRLRQAHDALLVMSDDADPSVAVGAKFALHRIGDTRQSHDLELTSRDPSPRTRGDTAMVLGLLGEPTAVNVLFPMLSDSSPPVRLQAAEALWRLGNEQGLNHLVAASVSGYADDRMIALLALAGPKDRRVLGHLQGALTSEYDEVSLVAARGCGMLGSDAGYGVALKCVGSSDPRQRLLAAMAFGGIGRSDSQPQLATLLKDAAQDVRLAAAIAILQLHP